MTKYIFHFKNMNKPIVITDDKEFDKEALIKLFKSNASNVCFSTSTDSIIFNRSDLMCLIISTTSHNAYNRTDNNINDSNKSTINEDELYKVERQIDISDLLDTESNEIIDRSDDDSYYESECECLKDDNENADDTESSESDDTN